MQLLTQADGGGDAGGAAGDGTISHTDAIRFEHDQSFQPPSAYIPAQSSLPLSFGSEAAQLTYAPPTGVAPFDNAEPSTHSHVPSAELSLAPSHTLLP
jgi:hypothetical protein